MNFDSINHQRKTNIIFDEIEKYKLDFYKLLNETKLSHLEFLENEKKLIKSTLENEIKFYGDDVKNDLDENGSTQKFMNYFKSDSFNILSEYKEDILNLINVDELEIEDTIISILEKYDFELLYSDDDNDNNNSIFTIDSDFVADYLKNYTYTFFYPQYFTKNHKIYNFVENEITKVIEKITTSKGNSNISNPDIETPEIDFSETPPLERMIILEKLGIIKYIQSIQNDSINEMETARILSSFTGIKIGTIAKNLGVMLGHKKNDSDKNSPYKNPKNQQLANNKLNYFNIDLTKIIK